MEREDLELEIKQLKNVITVLRGIVQKQSEDLQRYDKILCDWITYEKEELAKIKPVNAD